MSQGKSKQAKAHEFSAEARREIMARDHNECIFCRRNYQMQGATWMAKEVKSIMHYIPRSKGGLGIPQNGAIGCIYHHDMMDNGNRGNRGEMLCIFRIYLQEQYPEWKEEDLTYDKWKFLKC